MILLTAAESRELDRLSTSQYGIPSYTLMTRAGEAVAETVTRRWPAALVQGVLVLAGKGNNGGDGFVAARALLAGGTPVKVRLVAAIADLKGDAARACRDYIAAGGALTDRANAASLEDEHPGVVIDAIFGTGLNAPISGAIGAVIDSLNGLGAPIVAIDIASGVHADSGAIIGVAVKAALTVTFGFAKYGHVSYPGADHCGDLEVADIGFASRALEMIAPPGRLLEIGEARSLMRPRALNSHKGSYGHVLIIAGGRGKAGAAILAARGALRAGAGLVTAAIPDGVASIVAAGQPELMTAPIDAIDGRFAGPATIARLQELVAGKDAIVIGPGIGNTADTQSAVAWLVREGVSADRPLLIDADGLNALAALGPELLRSARGPTVLTPHPGEMARLLDTTTAAVNSDRIEAARNLVNLTGANVLLKGARSVIVSAMGTVSINASGNPGMATPGMGDVLSGLIGALMGQGMPAAEAMRLGVFVHGLAADRLATTMGPFGYLAGDLANELPMAFAATAA